MSAKIAKPADWDTAQFYNPRLAVADRNPTRSCARMRLLLLAPPTFRLKLGIPSICPGELHSIWSILISTEIAKTPILSPPSLYLADMNSHNFSTNAQKTVPPEYVPPMSLHRFCEITGLSKVSAWRYEKRGWLRIHLIANRRYILAADVADFKQEVGLR